LRTPCDVSAISIFMFVLLFLLVRIPI